MPSTWLDDTFDKVTDSAPHRASLSPYAAMHTPSTRKRAHAHMQLHLVACAPEEEANPQPGADIISDCHFFGTVEPWDRVPPSCKQPFNTARCGEQFCFFGRVKA